jgi:hypothetical protein
MDRKQTQSADVFTLLGEIGRERQREGQIERESKR